MATLKPYTPTTTGWTATVVNSVLFEKIRSLPVGATYTLVDGESITPDLVAHLSELEDVNYAWIIMAYNGFLDIRELSTLNGVRDILIPDKTALIELITSLTQGG